MTSNFKSNDLVGIEAFTSLLKNIQVGYIQLSVEKNAELGCNNFIIEDANPKFVDFMQMPLEESVGKDVRDVIPKTESYWFEMMTKVAAEDSDVCFEGYNSSETLFFKITGYTISENVIALLLYDLTDQIKYEEDLKEHNEEINAQNEEFRALNEELIESYTSLDISKKDLEIKDKELEKTNQMLQAVLDHIPVRVFWKDLESNYLGCNKHFAGDAGQDNVEDVIGKTDLDFFAADIGNAFRADDRLVMDTGEPKLNFEEPQAQEGEQLRYLKTNKVPLLNDLNEVIGVLGTYEDITELKKIQTDLVLAKEKAEESDRLKSAFLANMSHEIRTPMNGIVGFAQLLNEGELPTEERSYFINIINDSCNQLLRIVNDIIDISKIESGQVKINKSRVDLKQVVKDVLGFYTPIANKKGLEIIHNSNFEETKECVVNTDETKLRQVVDNILSNAIKFTSSGTVKIDCKKSSDKLFISICDTGIGIEESQYDIIFDRFGQASSNSDEKYGGTGLGLSICKAYIERMGGKVWLDSKVGEGSCFFVEIPIV